MSRHPTYTYMVKAYFVSDFISLFYGGKLKNKIKKKKYVGKKTLRRGICRPMHIKLKENIGERNDHGTKLTRLFSYCKTKSCPGGQLNNSIFKTTDNNIVQVDN